MQVVWTAEVGLPALMAVSALGNQRNVMDGKTAKTVVTRLPMFVDRTAAV